MPKPGVIAAEIVEDLEAALAEFAEIATSPAGIENPIWTCSWGNTRSCQAIGV